MMEQMMSKRSLRKVRSPDVVVVIVDPQWIDSGIWKPVNGIGIVPSATGAFTKWNMERGGKMNIEKMTCIMCEDVIGYRTDDVPCDVTCVDCLQSYIDTS